MVSETQQEPSQDPIQLVAVMEQSKELAAAHETNLVTQEDSDTSEQDAETIKYPPRVQLSLLTLALMITIFISQLDKSIVVNAVPTITRDFDSLKDVGWYGSAFLLTQMALQPTWGRLYTYFNSKWLFMLSIFIFEAGSVICATAPNSMVFVVGRAIAGIGGSGIFGGALAIVSQTIPLKDRPMYIGLVSCMFGVASLLGPLVGGIITDSWLTWRFCFWVNLPFGTLTILIIMFTYRPVSSKYASYTLKEKLKGLDLFGGFILICGTTCLLLALQWGGTSYSWGNSRVWGCLIGFGISAFIFIIWQIRAKDRATVPIHVVTQKTVAISCIYATCFSIAIITHTFYLPIFYQAVQQTTAAQSGVRVLAYGLPITIATMVSGITITKTGYYVPFMWFGGAVFTTAACLLYTLEVNSSAKHWAVYSVLGAIGFGSSVQIPLLAINNVLPSQDIPTGSSLIVFFQSLGGALGLSIAQNLFATRLERELEAIEGVDVTTVISQGASDIKAVVPEQFLMSVLEAYHSAVQSAFILSIVAAGIAFVASFGMEWKKMRGRNEKTK